MSAKNRKRADGKKPKKNPFEYHASPRWAIDVLLPYIPIPPMAEMDMLRVVDAGCGKGEWLEAEVARWPDALFMGIENHLTRARIAEKRLDGPVEQGRLRIYHSDFLLWKTTGDASPHLVTSNPPYSKAGAFLDVALAMVKPTQGTVALYLRLDWLAGVKRHPRHLELRPDVFVLARRPSHRPDGKTDAQSYCLVVYHPKSDGRWTSVLGGPPPRPKKKRKLPKKPA